MNARTVETKRGAKVRVLEGGRGKPLVFLHGAGGLFGENPFLDRLAERYHVLAPELPGYGESRGEELLDDMLDFALHGWDVVAALGVERPHLVGHSMGGAVALQFAASNPGRVSSLTLIAPAGFGREVNAAFIDGFVMMERRRDAQEVLRLLVHEPDLVSRAMVEDVLRYKRLDGVTAALGAIAAEWFPGGRQRSLLGNPLRTLGTPVQIIWGREDRIIPAAHGAAFAGTIPVHTLESAGHLPHMEKSAEVNRLIAGFIDGTA